MVEIQYFLQLPQLAEAAVDAEQMDWKETA
jgi:hypothetical protein